jgi:CRP-like cAMP-binding protein
VDAKEAKAIESGLRASRLFGSLDAALIAELARITVSRTFARGAALWRAGEPAGFFTVITRGLVEIVRQAADGLAADGGAIIAIFGPRESIGDVAAVRQAPYPAGALALTQQVDVLMVPAGSVVEAMRSHAAVAAAVNSSLVEHTHALQEKIRIMTAGAVPRRLATLVLHLADRFGDEIDDGSILVPVALSRSELARIVGATVETTIRAMSRWRKQGLLQTTPQGFLVRDLEALRAIAVGSEEAPGG